MARDGDGGRANLPAEKEVANNFLSQTPLEPGFCVPIEEGGPDKGMEGKDGKNKTRKWWSEGHLESEQAMKRNCSHFWTLV